MSFEERCNESDFFDMEIGLRVHIRACYAEIDRLTYELKVTEGIAGARELDLAELKAKPSLPEQGVKEAVEILEKLQDHVDYDSSTITCPKMAFFIEAGEVLFALRTQPVPGGEK